MIKCYQLFNNMSRETTSKYNPEKEKKRKEQKSEIEMAETIVEYSSIATIPYGVGTGNMLGHGEILTDNLDKLKSAAVNMEAVKETKEYAQIYEGALDKVDKSMREDKERAEKRIREIREKLKRKKEK